MVMVGMVAAVVVEGGRFKAYMVVVVGAKILVILTVISVSSFHDSSVVVFLFVVVGVAVCSCDCRVERPN